jgi:hypothetical protein
MLKIKFVVVTKNTKNNEQFFTSCFEENFRPIKNIDTTIKLMEYCKELNDIKDEDHYYTLCEKLFACSTGKCLIDNLSLVSIDHNEYNVWIIVSPQIESYAIVQLNEVSNFISVFSIKDWLKLHRPIPGYSTSEIDNINTLHKKSEQFQVYDSSEIKTYLQVVGIIF